MLSFLYFLFIVNSCGILYTQSFLFLVPVLKKHNINCIAEPPPAAPQLPPQRRRRGDGKKYIPSPEQQKEINSIFADIYKKINSASMNPPPTPPSAAATIASPPPSIFTEDEKTQKMVKEFQENYKKIMAGFDMRPPYYNTTTDTPAPEDDVVIKYAEIFEKKKLLDKLKDPNVPQIEKLRLLRIKKFNYDEW